MTYSSYEKKTIIIPHLNFTPENIFVDRTNLTILSTTYKCIVCFTVERNLFSTVFQRNMEIAYTNTSCFTSQTF